jgi:hypothetical protein
VLPRWLLWLAGLAAASPLMIICVSVLVWLLDVENDHDEDDAATRARLMTLEAGQAELKSTVSPLILPLADERITELRAELKGLRAEVARMREQDRAK